MSIHLPFRNFPVPSLTSESFDAKYSAPQPLNEDTAMKAKDIDTVSTIDRSDKALVSIERQMESFSVRQLKLLQSKITDLVSRKNEAEIEELRQKFAELAAESGHSYDEVIGRMKRGVRKGSGYTPKVRYRDPENPDNTWAGSGRMPRWLLDKKQANIDIEKFRVQ